MPMNARFLTSGNTLPYTPAADVAAGKIVVVGGILGVANVPITANTLGALAITGVFALAKSGSTGPVFAVGDPVFFNTSTELAVTAPGANVVFAGFCTEAATTSQTEVNTRLAPELTIDSAFFQIEDLAANGDIANRPCFSLANGGRIVDIVINGAASAAGIDDSNTSVWTFADAAGNTIVTKTYNTAVTFPAANTPTSLGAVSATHGVLTANEGVKFSVTNGTAADTPLTQVRIDFLRSR